VLVARLPEHVVVHDGELALKEWRGDGRTKAAIVELGEPPEGLDAAAQRRWMVERLEQVGREEPDTTCS